jgi:hypothetical protein
MTKIKCTNCGWSWYLSDGGLNPYHCHKCNYNNAKVGNTFSASDIVGKSLIAKKRVDIFDTVHSNRKRIAFVRPGDSVGIVYSWLSRPDGLWWQFKSGSNYYYAKHAEGLFDVSNLKTQGVLTLEEKKEQELFEELNYLEKMGYKMSQFSKSLLPDINWTKIGLIAGGALGLYIFAKSEISKAKRGQWVKK